MSKGDTFENDWLKLIFNAVAIANIADNAASGPLTSLYMGLCTGDPGEAGNQQTSEAAYTSYVRKDVARTGGGHTVSANSVSPGADVDFAAGTGTPSPAETVTYFTTGTVASTGITPTYAIGEIDVTED